MFEFITILLLILQLCSAVLFVLSKKVFMTAYMVVVCFMIFMVFLPRHLASNEKHNINKFISEKTDIINELNIQEKYILLGSGVNFVTNNDLNVTIDVSTFDNDHILKLLSSGYVVSDSIGNRITIEPNYMIRNKIDDYNKRFTEWLEENEDNFDHWWNRMYYSKNVSELSIISR